MNIECIHLLNSTDLIIAFNLELKRENLIGQSSEFITEIKSELKVFFFAKKMEIDFQSSSLDFFIIIVSYTDYNCWVKCSTFTLASKHEVD